MATDKDDIIAWLSDLSASIVADAADLRDLTARLADAGDLDAEAFAAEALAIMQVIGESADSSADFELIGADAGFSGDTATAGAVLSALGLSVAGCRVDWTSRPAARQARTRISEAGTVALAAIDGLGGEGADLYGWMQSVISIACRYVSDIAANATPVVRIETGISLPSTVLAYQLYGDASRAGGLVDIARAATPLVMPAAFEALQS